MNEVNQPIELGKIRSTRRAWTAPTIEDYGIVAVTKDDFIPVGIDQFESSNPGGYGS